MWSGRVPVCSERRIVEGADPFAQHRRRGEHEKRAYYIRGAIVRARAPYNWGSLSKGHLTHKRAAAAEAVVHPLQLPVARYSTDTFLVHISTSTPVTQHFSVLTLFHVSLIHFPSVLSCLFHLLRLILPAQLLCDLCPLPLVFPSPGNFFEKLFGPQSTLGQFL